MQHQDGYCDTCGADIRTTVAWLTFNGEAHCTDCALAMQAQAIRVPTKPEARDDGR